MHPHQEKTLTIHDLGHSGEGVGYVDGKTFFVDGALPGETVRVRVTDERKTFGFAKLLSIETASPDRVVPPCPVFGRCGGCQMQHLSYEKQLELKRKRVVDALERIGHIKGCEVLACKPSPRAFGYRNKIQLPVKGGCIGLYAKASHEIVPIDHCLIHCEQGEKVLERLKPLLLGASNLRHVLIKSAMHTEQTLVVLVTANTQAPLQLAKTILEKVPYVKGVIQNINLEGGNAILGPTYHLLAGQSKIYERLGGLEFSISAASFFQVNPLQAECLYSAALAFSQVSSEETVLDAYCGVGTLSLLFAKKAKWVTGIECVPQAIEDAKENGARNGIANVSFKCDHVELFIQKSPPVDLLVLNPPRKGCDPSLFAALEKRDRLKLSIFRAIQQLLRATLRSVRKWDIELKPCNLLICFLKHRTSSVS